MTRYRLTEVSPPIPPGISCRYLRVDPGETERARILVVAFQGDYPDGSRGSAHGRFIAASTMHGIHAFDPHAVVLDLRGLRYRWGNSLLGVFQGIAHLKDEGNEPGEPPFPVAVVTSEKSRDGFLSLTTPHGGEPPESHFGDMDAAIDYALRKAREWLAW